MKRCTLEKIKEFKLFGLECHAFYNSQRNCIDYFIKNIEEQAVDVFSLEFRNAQRIMVSIIDETSFKAFADILLLKGLEDGFEAQDDTLLDFQAFPLDLWEDCVLKEFKGFGIGFVEVEF